MISLLRAKLGRGKMMYIAHSYIIYECCEIFLVAVAREKERERSDSFGGILPEMKIHCYAIHRSVNNNAIQIYADERMYCQVIIMLFQLLLHCCSLSTTEHITYATIFYPNVDKTRQKNNCSKQKLADQLHTHAECKRLADLSSRNRLPTTQILTFKIRKYIKTK